MTGPVADQAGDVGSHTLVFVAGLHRSGTTPLTRLLGQHPQVSCFSDTGVKEDEGQHLQDVYPKARAYGGPGRFAFARQAHLTERSPLATQASADALFNSWAPYWDLSRPYLVEKSPPNLLMTRFLQALFPSAKFLVIVRHPVVVSLSTARWAGRRMPFSRLLEHWLLAHETFLNDARSIESLHVLKYEHLVSDPVETLAGLARFLRLDEAIPVGGLEYGRSSRYQSQWYDRVAGRRSWQTRRLLRRYGRRVAEFGYDLIDLDHVRPFPQPDVTLQAHD
jgi:hypothetical protein